MKRRLSLSAASRCETAKTKVCTCRCGGVLHGAARGQDTEFFAGLPTEDPHHAQPTRAQKKEIERKRKREEGLPLFDGVA